MNRLSLSLVIAAIEVMGFLGFVFFSEYLGDASSKYSPIAFSLAVVLAVFYRVIGAYSRKDIIWVAAATSVLFVSADQVLGFMFFPGLAKGIAFLSPDNFVRIAAMLVVGFALHLMLMFIARLLRRVRISD